VPVKLYYFTGTGNTLWIGKMLQALIPGAELIPIIRLDGQDEVRVDCEQVGFLFPLYYFGLPEVVRRLIQKVHLGCREYVFGLTTCGLPPFLAGGATQSLARLLRAKNKDLDAFFYVWMPGNNVIAYGAMPGLLIKVQLALARTRVRRIAQIVSDRGKHVENRSGIVSAGADSIHANWTAKLPGMDEAFYANQDCDRCGICEHVCPVDNIALEEGKPTWLHHCQQCVACIQLCPRQAIQYGGRTGKRRRYRNPEIELEEILAQKAR